MVSRKFLCTVTKILWLSPSVFELRFSTDKKLHFEPGQFLSIYIPDRIQTGRVIRRAYSFANAPCDIEIEGHALCVKYQAGGAGSEFLAGLRVGDCFEASAPYGHFFREPVPGQNACFISTSTGIAPIRSILRSDEFWDHRPGKVLNLFGARSESEILYAGEFTNVESIIALSQASAEWQGFRGRVTDYLRSLPASWSWKRTDFYICGNGAMVDEVVEILRDGHGVANHSIHRESFMPAKKKSA